jgi:hypothetical protein
MAHAVLLCQVFRVPFYLPVPAFLGMAMIAIKKSVQTFENWK